MSHPKLALETYPEALSAMLQVRNALAVRFFSFVQERLPNEHALLRIVDAGHVVTKAREAINRAVIDVVKKKIAADATVESLHAELAQLDDIAFIGRELLTLFVADLESGGGVRSGATARLATVTPKMEGVEGGAFSQTVVGLWRGLKENPLAWMAVDAGLKVAIRMSLLDAPAGEHLKQAAVAHTFLKDRAQRLGCSFVDACDGADFVRDLCWSAEDKDFLSAVFGKEYSDQVIEMFARAQFRPGISPFSLEADEFFRTGVVERLGVVRAAVAAFQAFLRSELTYV